MKPAVGVPPPFCLHNCFGGPALSYYSALNGLHRTITATTGSRLKVDGGCGGAGHGGWGSGSATAGARGEEQV